MKDIGQPIVPFLHYDLFKIEEVYCYYDQSFIFRVSENGQQFLLYWHYCDRMSGITYLVANFDELAEKMVRNEIPLFDFFKQTSELYFLDVSNTGITMQMRTINIQDIPDSELPKPGIFLQKD